VGKGLLVVLTALCLASPAAAERPARPGQFDYYLLSLSWSPHYCAEHRGQAASLAECAADRGFVLHGLWPEDENGRHPMACTLAAQVPGRLVDRMLPVMPSERLVQHEWAEHGTCSGLSMDAYFDDAIRAVGSLRIPPRLQQPTSATTMLVRDVKQLFARTNPGLTADMMTVVCDASAVREIHICLDKSLRFRACGAGQGDRCDDGRGRFDAAP
jgi:ribonuclease T2